MKKAIPLQVGKSLEKVDASLMDRSWMIMMAIRKIMIDALTPTHNPNRTELGCV
jgi:hypothetical protein